MGMGFFAKFGGEKLKQAKQSLTQAIVEFDPETASDAAIEMMDEQVDELSRELAKANQDLKKESMEADAAKVNYNRKVEVAGKLQDKIDEASGAKAKSLQTSLDTLLEDIESTRSDVELEIQEAADAQLVVDDFQQAIEMAVSKLKSARSDHKKAMGDMKRANLAEKRATDQANRQKKLAGIGGSDDGMSTALDAMKAATAERTANAEAAQTKADMLKPFDASEDKNIAALMDEIDGEDEPATTKDKVASLKGF